MSRNNFTPQGSARGTKRTVIYTGSIDLVKGQGLCYDRDYGTAANADGNRDVYVELPTPSNNLWFAGVCCENATADASGKTVVEIWEPGSVCEIAILPTATVGTSRFTALVASSTVSKASGMFVEAGFEGRGSALALQTKAALTGTSDTSIAPCSSSLAGVGVLTVSGTSYTLVSSGAFTNLSATLTGEEYVYIVAGAVDNQGSGASIAPTAGRYKITTRTDANTVVLDPAGSAPASATCDVAFYCVRGVPTVLAKLDDGKESGLVEWISITTDGSGTTANPCQVGGVTRIFGGFDLDVGNAIDTLANGTYAGQKKSYKLMGAITTSDYVLTITTGVCINPAGADATAAYQVCATVTMDAAADEVYAEWTGSTWVVTAFNFTVASNPVIA